MRAKINIIALFKQIALQLFMTNRPDRQEELHNGKGGAQIDDMPDNILIASSILQNIWDVVFRLSSLGIIQYVSPNVKTRYGYDPHNLIGQHIAKTTPAGELPKALEVVARTFSGEVVTDFEINQIDSNGNVIPMEICLNPVKQGDRIVAMQGVMRETTDRKKREAAQQGLAAIVEHTDAAIISMDLAGIILSWNKAAENTYGYN